MLGVRPARVVAAALGPLVSTYTAALVADTAVPVWHEARSELPLLFSASSASSAETALTLITPARDAAPARRLAIANAATELGLMQTIKHRLGELGEPYHESNASRYARAAKALTAA